MIEEAYCSYEVSKLLKEKGFDEECYSHYSSCGTCISYGSTRKDEDFRRPTQQMAMRWLREIHLLHVEILAAYHFRCFEGYSFEVYNVNEGEFINFASDKGRFKTNEEAVEASIKYCLENLI